MKVRTLLLMVVALLLPFAAAACGDDDSGDETTTTTEETTTTEAEETTTTEAEETTTTGATPSGPSDEEVSTALQQAFDVDATTADCAATELRISVSAESLLAIASGNRENIPEDEVADVENAIRAAFAACS